ncbi:Conserved_hypothetical protein [Hexamita inflata]|uniref:Uncharacterized protein n=1 Tax=Hexamita inflata TaxID=28002 RepID=A0AA86UFK7_9EUKA|nr:Conserved hypothetical protein [Hexamita inflata]
MKSNTFFGLQHIPEHIPTYDNVLPTDFSTEFQWATFKIVSSLRFQLKISSLDFSKQLEFWRIPAVDINVSQDLKQVELIGVDLYRSFANQDELLTWRKGNQHQFQVRPQNILLKSGQEVILRLFKFKKGDKQFCSVSFAPVDK